jgi:hypothetical protein
MVSVGLLDRGWQEIATGFNSGKGQYLGQRVLSNRIELLSERPIPLCQIKIG